MQEFCPLLIHIGVVQDFDGTFLKLFHFCQKRTNIPLIYLEIFGCNDEQMFHILIEFTVES